MWLGTMSSIWPSPASPNAFCSSEWPVLAAQLFVDGRGVDDVVAVGAALGRLQHRRQVDVAHAEVSQVARDGGGVGEIEAGVELQPVRRPPRRPLGLVLPGCGSLVVHGYPFYISRL